MSHAKRISMTSHTASFKQWRRAGLLCAIALVALTGTWLLMRAHAETVLVSAEAESGARTTSATPCPGTNASGGVAVQFGLPACPPASGTFTNPIKQNTADPAVMAWNGKYYLVSTGDFTIFESSDLVNWHTTGVSIFPNGHPWAINNFWAPDLRQVGNKFIFYYSADDGVTARVGAAVADNLLGPYTDVGAPIVSRPYGVIDVNYFKDDDGKQYLLWKEDAGNTRIFIQELAADGVTLVGTEKAILQKSLAWEGDAGIEGPWLMKKDGQYYLFYSGNFFGSLDYAVGVAKSATILGAYTKKADPILKGGPRWKSPGHNSVLSVGGVDYAFYHAWDGAITGNRVGMLDKITWSGGWPLIGTGVPTETPQPYPSL